MYLEIQPLKYLSQYTTFEIQNFETHISRYILPDMYLKIQPSRYVYQDTTCDTYPKDTTLKFCILTYKLQNTYIEIQPGQICILRYNLQDTYANFEITLEIQHLRYVSQDRTFEI